MIRLDPFKAPAKNATGSVEGRGKTPPPKASFLSTDQQKSTHEEEAMNNSIFSGEFHHSLENDAKSAHSSSSHNDKQPPQRNSQPILPSNKVESGPFMPADQSLPFNPPRHSQVY